MKAANAFIAPGYDEILLADRVQADSSDLVRIHLTDTREIVTDVPQSFRFHAARGLNHHIDAVA
jgi:hypothetical protein